PPPLGLDGGAREGDDRAPPYPERQAGADPPTADQSGGVASHRTVAPRGDGGEPGPQDPRPGLLPPGSIPRRPGVLHPARADVGSRATEGGGDPDPEGKLGPRLRGTTAEAGPRVAGTGGRIVVRASDPGIRRHPTP